MSADDRMLVDRLADELEYRVRTAATLAKGGHSIQGEVEAGRARIAALVAAQGTADTEPDPNRQDEDRAASMAEYRATGYEDEPDERDLMFWDAGYRRGYRAARAILRAPLSPVLAASMLRDLLARLRADARDEDQP